MAKSPIVGVILAGLSAAVVSASTLPANAAAIELINASPATIDKFYVAACGKRSWGPDLTGARQVPPGGKFIVQLTHGCYDLKVRTQRGRECIVPNARIVG